MNLFSKIFPKFRQNTHVGKYDPLLQWTARGELDARHCEGHSQTLCLPPRQDDWDWSSLPVSALHPQLSYVMSGYRCFVCPVEYNNDTNSFTVDCEPSDLFRLQEYNIPEVIQSVIGLVRAIHTGQAVPSK